MALAREIEEASEPDRWGPTFDTVERGPIQIWDTSQARLLRSIDDQSADSHGGEVQDVILLGAPDIAAVQSTFAGYADGLRLSTGTFFSPGYHVPHGRFLLSPNGDRLASILAGAGAYCNIILYGPDFHNIGDVEARARDQNSCIARPENFSSDLSRMAVVVVDDLDDEDGTQPEREILNVQVLDLRQDTVLRSVPGDLGAVSPDGTKLAVWEKGTGSGGRGVIYDVASGRRIATLEGHQQVAADIAWSPDGRTIATGGEDSLVFLWDAQTGRQKLMFGGFPGPVCGVGFSPSGEGLITRCREMVRAYDVRTGRVLGSFEFRQDDVMDAGYSPDVSAIAVLRGRSPREMTLETWVLERR